MGAVDVLSLISQASERTQVNNVARADSVEAIRQAGRASENLLRESNAARLEVTAQELEAKKRAQDNSRTIASNFGGNLDDPTTSIIGRLGEVFRSNTLKSIQTKEEVSAIDSQSFISNPFSWVQNQFVADGLDREAAGYDDQASTAAARMSELNSIVSSGAKAQTAIAQTLTDESIANTLEMNAADLGLKAQELKLKNASNNLTAINALQQGDKDTIALEARKLTIIASEESRLHARASHSAAMQKHQEFMAGRENALKMAKLNLSNAKDRAAITSLELEAKQAAKASMDTSMDIIRGGGHLLKNPAMAALTDAQIKQMMKTKEGKANVDILFNAGMSDLNGYKIIGTSMMDTYLNILDTQSIQAFKDSPDTSIAIKYLESVNNRLYGDDPITKAPYLKAGANRATVVATGNKLAIQDVTLWSGDAEAEGSLYKAPLLAQIASQGNVINTKFHEVVLAPQVAGDSGNSSFPTLLKLGEQALDANRLTVEELAEGLHAVYSTSVDYNNQVAGLSYMGIPIQRGYNVRVKRLGKRSIVDASNKTKLLHFLVERESLGILRDNQESIGALTLPIIKGINSLLGGTDD